MLWPDLSHYFFLKIKLLNTAASLNVRYPTVNHNGIDAYRKSRRKSQSTPNQEMPCVNEISCLAFRENTSPQCVIRHDGHYNTPPPHDSKMIRNTAETLHATPGKGGRKEMVWTFESSCFKNWHFEKKWGKQLLASAPWGKGIRNVLPQSEQFAAGKDEFKNANTPHVLLQKHGFPPQGPHEWGFQ